ncbi:YdcF family protein [Robinsoniella peoriensis]|uniref:YdcF family protein n=1 Tax=Robinsoniella peoriensis TaxID=180332 RepID=UPI0005C7CD0B|nr:YdcF family protein [Robinsoniella peoriensis]
MKHFYDDITEFIFVENDPAPSDMIFIPGGSYGQIALHAADLYKGGYADRIMVSGKFSVLKGKFAGVDSPLDYCGMDFQTESQFLSKVLQDAGVPAVSIYMEEEATFTYENAIYCRKLAEKLGLQINKAIISCQAYHARRCLMYYQLLFPETVFYVCPAETRGINRNNWFMEEKKIDQVLEEVERCGRQFHKIMHDLIDK